MVLALVNVDEITKVINSFKLRKSPDVERITIWLLKQYSQELTKPLSTVVNSSFSEGLFPDQLKLAKIIPIYNRGQKEC